MTAPTADPRCMQIMQKLAVVLGGISQANGFYTDVAGAGIEPLSFDGTDVYPRIVVHEETSTIGDQKSQGYQDDLILEIVGYGKFAAGEMMARALRLRDDITKALQCIRARDFLDAHGDQLVNECALAGERAIKNSDQTAGVLEITVHWSCSYRQFFPRPKG